MIRLTRCAVIAASLPCSFGTAFSQNPDDVEVKLTHVAGPVHVLEGAGGNIGVSAGEDGVLIVDDQFDWLAPKLRAALESLGSGRPAFVLNTHWHGDHTGGNPVFGRDGVIVAQANVRRRLAEGSSAPGREKPPAPPVALPVVTFDESLSVHFNGEEIRSRHFAHAHTDGDAVVLFTHSNVLHVGDLLFSGRFPFIDVDSGGSAVGLLAAVEELLDTLPDGARIIQGHGPVAGREELVVYREMLADTIARVRARVAAGASLEQLQEEGLGERWKDWSWRFIDEKRYIETLYRSLTGPAGD